MNIVFVSHCNFSGNSAMHLFSIAQEFVRRGHECIVAVPDRPETVEKHGQPLFRVATYDEIIPWRLSFADRQGPSLVHGWSPRGLVKETVLKVAARNGCPYFIHMEDNEEQIVADELPGFSVEELKRLPASLMASICDTRYRTDVGRYEAYAKDCAGYTCLIEPLLEYNFSDAPSLVFWPGFDEEFEPPLTDRSAQRERYGVAEDEQMILYSGNVHQSIVDDVRTLYAAVALLQRRGRPVRLVRTGWDYADLGITDEELDAMGVLRLGFVDRAEIPILTRMADILVQPGKSDRFNDYRFPSKLPEYLVSGVPVVLPESNIGKYLREGEHALKLTNGDAFEIAEKVEQLIDQPDLAAKLGQNARAFAKAELTWSRAVDKLEPFYKSALEKYEARHKTDGLKAGKNNPPRHKLLGGEHRPFDDPDEESGEDATQYPVDLIAFYLPQYHPIPENDRWWGKGFTEWTNVTRGPVNFAGHDQPRLPTELGFYDLRVPEVMRSQAKLAKSHGVSAFCFYYYWFDGKRLLEKPIDQFASDPEIDFPFCICWANEPWSRRWDGSDSEVLMPQTYEKGFAEAWINDALPLLKNPKYLRVDGEPVVLIYKIADLPDPIQAIQTWQRIARENGLPGLHLVAVQSFGLDDPRPYGLNAAVEFQPHHTDRQLVDLDRLSDKHPDFSGYIEDYIAVAMRSIQAPPKDFVHYRGCFPRWDNTARRKRKGHVLVNDSPRAYGQWLRHLVHESLVRREQQKPMVFINAWNEWAEGTYLEPDERDGRTWLNVTREALHAGIGDFVHGRTDEREVQFLNAVKDATDRKGRNRA